MDRTGSDGIIKPFSSDAMAKFLILVISPSQERQKRLEDMINEFGYRIAGPYESITESLSFLDEVLPDIVIFDSITSQSELVMFSELLSHKIKDLPMIAVYKDDEYAIIHPKIAYIEPPINPVKLKGLIDLLVERRAPTELDVILDFTNSLFLRTGEMVTSEYKKEIFLILHNTIGKFTALNIQFVKLADGRLGLKMASADDFDKELYIETLQFTIRELISEINTTMEANWGGALIRDVIEAIILPIQQIPETILDVLNILDIDVSKMKTSFEIALPVQEATSSPVVVAKLVLGDRGPEMREVTASQPELLPIFDDRIASRIITLVGQGASYHEGIFGPIPIPSTNNLVAMIWSRLLGANIADERMSGKTLVVVAVAFEREIMTTISQRDQLTEFFSPLLKTEHTDEITMQLLELIKDKCLAYFG